MLPELALSTMLLIQPSLSDPLESTLDFHANMQVYVQEVEAAERREARAEKRAEARREREAQEASRSSRESSNVVSSSGSSSLPSLLQLIRSNESGGNYSAYNASGCEGYGCGGAYQMHALYASTWAERAGYSGMSSNAATWPADIQDAVALDLYYSTNPDGYHWCAWTDYC